MMLTKLSWVENQNLSFAAKLTRILIKLNLLPVSVDEEYRKASFSYQSWKFAVYLFITYLPTATFFAIFVYNHNLIEEYFREGFKMIFTSALQTGGFATGISHILHMFMVLTLIVRVFFNVHSYPKWEYKIKNVLEVCYIFLKSKLYDNSKKYLKILGLGPKNM